MRPEGTPATLLALLQQGPRQARDLAERLGIDTSAVRRHLEGLRSEGLVETEDVVAGPGRPKKMYALTPAGRETFPRDYALLLGLLLDKLAATHGRRNLEDTLASLAADVARDAATRASPAARAQALLALYNQLGFDASLEKVPGGLRLVQRNCIFLKTATRDPDLLCRCFDEGIIRAALGPARVELEASLALGNPACRHRILLKDAPAQA